MLRSNGERSWACPYPRASPHPMSLMHAPQSSLSPHSLIMPRGRGRCRSGLLTLRATANRKNWGLFRLAVRSLAAPPATAPKRRYAAPAPRAPRPSHATAQLSVPSLGSGMQRRSKRAREMMKRCRFCRFAQMPPSQEHTHLRAYLHTCQAHAVAAGAVMCCRGIFLFLPTRTRGTEVFRRSQPTS